MTRYEKLKELVAEQRAISVSHLAGALGLWSVAIERKLVREHWLRKDLRKDSEGRLCGNAKRNPKVKGYMTAGAFTVEGLRALMEEDTLELTEDTYGFC